MKNFITSHSKKLIMLLMILLVSVLFTTTSVTTPLLTYDERIDIIPTVSVPTGSVVSRGLDVSSYQGEIDFNKVKSSGYDFVILRVGTSKGMDKMFHKYYADAVEADLNIGCYFYTYATTVKEIQNEAYKVLREIQGKTFTYPVFCDFEHPETLSYDRIQLNTQMVTSFCSIIKRGGYYPGLYTSVSIHSDFLDTKVVDSTLDVWIASYIDYTSVDIYGYCNDFSMWQYSDVGTVDGINCNVDTNLSFVDYPSLIKEFNYRISKIR